MRVEATVLSTKSLCSQNGFAASASDRSTGSGRDGVAGFHCELRNDVLARLAGFSLTSVAAFGVSIIGTTALAAEPVPGDVTMESCAAINIALQRLACYDSIAGRAPPAGVSANAPSGLQATPSGGVAAVPPTSAAAAGAAINAAPAGQPAGSGLVIAEPQEQSTMSSFWELDDKDKRGTFKFLSYRPNYVLPVHYTNRINRTPTSPTPDRSGTLPDYRPIEMKMQISLRTKIAQGLLLPNADLWFAYTQQSLWQLWNKQESSPFRSTDYEPEAIYVLSVPKTLRGLPFGWQFRMLQAGIAHQSNGQTRPLSRSWNRVYAGAGFENGDVSVTVRALKRLSEDATQDDNPDITYYRGRGDVALNWTPGNATASLLWRTNFRSTNRGSLQFDWTYPVDSSKPKGLRWYAQVFTGYGETLLDYNFKQTSVGAGLSLFEF